MEFVDLAIFGSRQSPSAAEVNYANALFQRLWHPFARNLMRSRKEQYVDTFVAQCLPAKRLQRRRAVAADVRIDVVQPNQAVVFTLGSDKHSLLHPRMPETK